MSVNKEVNKQITKINRITNSIYNNTNKKWKESRVDAERIVIKDLIESRLDIVGVKEGDKKV